MKIYYDNYYVTAETAIAQASMMAMQYALEGFLTTTFLDKDTKTAEVTVHYQEEHKPDYFLWMKATSIEWHEHNHTEDGHIILTLNLTFETLK